MSRRLNIEPFPVRAKLQERGFAGGGKEFYPRVRWGSEAVFHGGGFFLDFVPRGGGLCHHSLINECGHRCPILLPEDNIILTRGQDSAVRNWPERSRHADIELQVATEKVPMRHHRRGGGSLCLFSKRGGSSTQIVSS